MNAFRTQLESDLSNIFLSPGGDSEGRDFAEPCIYTPKRNTVAPYTLFCIEDDTTEYELPDGANAKQQSDHLHILVQESLVVGGVQKDDRVVVRGINYSIATFRSDGNGTVALTLYRTV